jgi:hypothetical protein
MKRSMSGARLKESGPRCKLSARLIVPRMPLKINLLMLTLCPDSLHSLHKYVYIFDTSNKSLICEYNCKSHVLLNTIINMSKVPIPFSEPPWLMGLPSAYYNESHKKWQKTCRALVDELLMPEGGEWEKAGDVPGISFINTLPSFPIPRTIKWLHKLGIYTLPGGLKVEEFDYLHTLIYVDEMARTGSLGPSGAVTTGIAFGLPPILKFGSQELQERFVPDIITGKKRICIAITEPEAGSDVSNVQTTARRSKDGKHFIVNGTKKWFAPPFSLRNLS